MPLSSVLGAQSLVRPGVCTSTTRPASPFEGQTIYETDTDLIRSWNGSSWVRMAPTTVYNYNASQTITTTTTSWTVPTLASPIVKVTVIAGGGGGAGGVGGGAGGAGGNSVFGVGQAWAITATGGAGGLTVNNNGSAGTAGFSAANGGMAGGSNTTVDGEDGQAGLGGQIKIGYVDLTGVSTVNITVGTGGTAGTGTAFARAGGAGGRGEVIIEYAV